MTKKVLTKELKTDIFSHATKYIEQQENNRGSAVNNLPLLANTEAAITHYNSNTLMTDAEKAYVIGFLSQAGLSNKAIRKALNIDKVYTVTHLKRAGTILCKQELTLWHKNPIRITLGHVRAIAKLPQTKRDALFRGLLHKKTPVHKLAAIAKGKVEDQNTDIKRYERIMSEVLGRPIKIQYNSAKQSGALTLDFFALDDLEHLAKALGFDAAKHL